MKVSRIHSVTTVGDEVLRYVTFEFYTPSSHEITLWLDADDKPVRAEEIAYGSWFVYDESEVGGLLEYLSDHDGIELQNILEEARKA